MSGIGLDVYDHEVDQIQKVLEILQARSQGRRNYDDFDREIHQRFEEIGFKVAVNWYETNLAEVKRPDITIVDRIEKHVFDHDRQVHEVTNDLLGLGEGGVIKTDPATVKSFVDKHSGHQH